VDGKSRRERAAIAISIVGLLISFAAAVFAYRAQKETSDVHLRAAGSITSLGSTPAGYAVQISFTNDSLRPVIVRSIELRVGGMPVAGVTRYLLDSRAGTDASALGDEPLEASRSLPFALSARGATTLTGFADFADFGFFGEREHARWRRKVTELCDQLQGFANDTPAPPVTVEVKIEPSRTIRGQVHIVDLPIGGDTWSMDMAGPKEGPTGISVWRRESSPSALRLLRVRVWRAHGGVIRSRSLPVVGAGSAQLNFRALPRGDYRAALSQGEALLASGRFHVPLEQARETIFPSDGQLENGQCLELEGERDVYLQPGTRYEHPKGG
jgi:hypothetical protein